MDPGLFVAILAAVTVTAASLGIAQLATKGREQDDAHRDELLRQLALSHGGRWQDGGWGETSSALFARGEDSLALRRATVAESESGRGLVLELTLPTQLPHLAIYPGGQQYGIAKLLTGQDIQIGHAEIDARFRIRGDDEAAVCAMLRGESVRILLALEREVAWAGVKLSLEPGPEPGTSKLQVVRTEFPTGPGMLELHVDRCCELGEALTAGWMKPWTDAAGRWRLQMQRGAAASWRALEGEVAGVPIRVREGSERGVATTWIELRFTTISGLRAAAKEQAQRAGWHAICAPVGNPVLDMLVSAKARDRAQLKRLLSGDDLTGLVLEVLHGNPGSELNQQGLTVCMAGHGLQDLVGPIQQALELTRALQARLRQLNEGARPPVG